MIINRSYHNGWDVLEPNQKAAELIIVYRTKKELLVFAYSFLFVFNMLEEKSEDTALIFFYFMHINTMPIFSFFSRLLNF